MKTILIVVSLLFLCPIANAQIVQRGDTCANCTPERSPKTSDRAVADQRAQQVANQTAVAGRRDAGPYTPNNQRVFMTNFLMNNDSDKEIREIRWTATLTNSDTQKLVGTFPMYTKQKIGPHKHRRLKQPVFIPLKDLVGSTVSANNPNVPPNQIPVDEKYEIVEIVYKDKSVSKP